VKRYEAAGWWKPETLGDLLAAGLAAAPDAAFGCVLRAGRDPRGAASAGPGGRPAGVVSWKDCRSPEELVCPKS